MTAAAKQIRPDRKTTYTIVPGTTEKEGRHWSEGLERRNIAKVGHCEISWPVEIGLRLQLARDWHMVACRRAWAAGIDDRLLGHFYRYWNLTDFVGELWPSEATLAACVNCSTKTVQRRIADYTAIGILRTEKHWRNARIAKIIILTFPADLNERDLEGAPFRSHDHRRLKKYLDTACPNSQVQRPGEYLDTRCPEYLDTVCPKNSDEHADGGPPAPSMSSPSSEVVDDGSGSGAPDAPATITYDPADEVDSHASFLHSMHSFGSLDEELCALQRERDRQMLIVEGSETNSRRLEDWFEAQQEWIFEKWTEKSQTDIGGDFDD